MMDYRFYGMLKPFLIYIFSNDLMILLFMNSYLYSLDAAYFYNERDMDARCLFVYFEEFYSGLVARF